jgi:hypothetical protein
MFLRYKGLEGIMDSYITNVGDIKWVKRRHTIIKEILSNY